MEIRPYESRDADALWARKREFERGLGAGTGGDDKAARYDDKLTDDYRREWLDWVARCVDEDSRCVTVAVDADRDAGSGPTVDPAGTETHPDPTSDCALAGYVFVLPESHRFVWDAAVLNEIYVHPDHRGTGVADDLMAAAVELAGDQELPLDRLVLDVDPENDRATAFYERHGFEHWGEMVAKQL